MGRLPPLSEAASTDVLTTEQRRRAMRAVRSRDTRPELTLRRAIFARGLRYRLHSDIPGRPDIVFSRARVAVFVDGCYWHSCPLHATRPKARAEWWAAKLTRNVERDREVDVKLASLGWWVIRVWEHEIRTSRKHQIKAVVDRIETDVRERLHRR